MYFFHLVLLPEDVEHIKAWLLHYYPTELAMEIIHFDASLVEGNVRVRGKRKELGSPLNFARFWLPDLLPDITQERILYLDDDTLVRGNLREMRDLTLQPGHVAAFVPDTVNKMKMFLNFDNPKVVGTRIKKNAMAFNAGVFLADMQEWRRQAITPKLLFWSRLNVEEDVYGARGGGGASQPPMLIAFDKVSSALPERWHMRHFGWKKAQTYTTEDVRGGKLLHFNGGDKPWVHRSKWFLLWYKYFLEDPSGEWDIRPDARESAQVEIEAVVNGQLDRALTAMSDAKRSVHKHHIITPARPGRIANPNAFLDSIYEKTLLRTLHDSIAERVLEERGLG
ncbi:hypothetical protein SARC_09332 [Sphaeroforma arctica JP610]|uniref:Glycosyl transferase 64 domain-containing protein n=1 Tax=Sphaeroforma arctica JP610 TaxID=667725 RepID=A0A0L0FN65_9EUKA|nr:hypothetical protein SARC_09332 [Sphaeroforma arctica JP610]KNC78230.1 hypothetical protein SARC_09332 [Sphaeroforma arctica JP610]|eukprot:XP_014152132.1 hypothetical protein SARC_09332 [Sphaeroforma arctica JP610]